MKPLGIFYATRHGHARRVAQHVADYFHTHGFETEVWSVLNVPDNVDVSRDSAVVVTASVHMGRHEPEMIRFVKRHLHELNETRNAFITVTLSEAGAERADATPERRERAAANVAQMTARFVAETGWQPQRIQPVAGALLYTKYNPLLRFVLKFICWMAGDSTDTSKDHVYTDWSALNRLASGIADEVRS
jgi:menaquinone-dependent protoporphyrinogen oxidase